MSTSGTIGSVTGSASLVGDEFTMAVNATYSGNNTKGVSTYQFNLDTSTLTGSFWSMTSATEVFTPWTYSSGQAALVSCDAPLAEFSSSCSDVFCDNDNDGYDGQLFGDGDCDDNNSTIYPGATEICGDGIDQDCSGADEVCPTDDNDLDNDNDGYNTDDCNDNNSTIYPGATEICGDGIDQDCSGEDLSCPVGSDTYTDNGNGTVTDTVTDLIWQQDGSDSTRNWQLSIESCRSLTLGGSSAWRLPNLDELVSLVDTSVSPKIDPIFTGTNTSDIYWSSTPGVDNADGAWGVSFATGDTIFGSKTRSKYYRCVR